MFCKSVLLAGISIICGGAGYGRVRQGESRCTSSAAGAAGVGDDEVDDEVTALPGIIGDLEIRHVPALASGGAGRVEFGVIPQQAGAGVKASGLEELADCVLEGLVAVEFEPKSGARGGVVAGGVESGSAFAEGARPRFGDGHAHAELERSAEEGGGEVEGGRTGGECAWGDVEPGGGQRGETAVGENARAVSGGATIIVQTQQDRQRLRMHETFHTALADWFISCHDASEDGGGELERRVVSGTGGGGCIACGRSTEYDVGIGRVKVPIEVSTGAGVRVL